MPGEPGAKVRARIVILLLAAGVGTGSMSLGPMGIDAAAAQGAGPAPAAFELTVEGGQAASPSAGARVDGSYAASAPFCAGGEVEELERDLSGRWHSALRRFVCADGSGSVTARTWLLGAGDELAPEWGTWRIVHATGRYRGLRGIGTYVRMALEGGGIDEEALPFFEVWRGDVDFDDTAPTVSISRATIAAVPGSSREYAVRLDLSAHDDVPGRTVSFLAIARSRYLLGAKSGTTSSGAASVSVRVRPEPDARTIRLELDVSDPVGNQVILVRRVEIPRRP